MTSDSTPQLAYAKKNDSSKLIGIFSLVLVVLGVIGMLYIQQPLKESQDLRQDASVSTGNVLISTSPATSTEFEVGEETTVNLLINTQNTQTDGVQLTFNIVGETIDPPLVEVQETSGLRKLAGEVEGGPHGYLVTLVATPQIGQPFAVNNPTTFATITFTPAAAGTIAFNFDTENSIATVYNSNPVEDQLKTIASVQYTVADSTAASPSPSPSASPAASPSPSPNDLGIGGGTIKQCNESCTSNAECAVNHRCYNGACRLVTNPSSTTCVNPPDGGLQRTCNQYCADTRECASGYSCLQNKCRRADNPDNTTCSAPSAATQQQIVGSCGKACDANADCAVNLRCYNGACRLATNPSSTSCSATTAKTVSPIYDKGGDTSGQDNDDATSTAGGTIRTSPQPSVSPSASPVSTTPQSEKTALDTLRGLLPARTLALVAIGVGLLLLVLLLLSRLTGRKSRPMTPPIPPQPAAPQPTAYEQELQAKVDALKKESSGPPPSAMTSAPMMQQPPVPPAPPTMRPVVPASPSMPTTPPTETPVFNQPPSMQSSMLERIKEKGINPPNSNQT